MDELKTENLNALLLGYNSVIHRNATAELAALKSAIGWQKLCIAERDKKIDELTAVLGACVDKNIISIDGVNLLDENKKLKERIAELEKPLHEVDAEQATQCTYCSDKYEERIAELEAEKESCRAVVKQLKQQLRDAEERTKTEGERGYKLASKIERTYYNHPRAYDMKIFTENRYCEIYSYAEARAEAAKENV